MQSLFYMWKTGMRKFSYIKEINKNFIERGFALQNCVFKFENRWKTSISRTCS